MNYLVFVTGKFFPLLWWLNFQFVTNLLPALKVTQFNSNYRLLSNFEGCFDPICFDVHHSDCDTELCNFSLEIKCHSSVVSNGDLLCPPPAVRWIKMRSHVFCWARKGLDLFLLFSWLICTRSRWTNFFSIFFFFKEKKLARPEVIRHLCLASCFVCFSLTAASCLHS